MFRNKIYTNDKELLDYILREYNSDEREAVLIEVEHLVGLLANAGKVEIKDGVAYAKE